MLLENKNNVQNDSDAKIIGAGLKFERVRRITGYLVGNLDRFNNAKLT